MTAIFLVRHGEAAEKWGQSPDPGLSELGHEQAAAVAQALSEHGALHLISSPLLRARETAAPLASALGAEVEIVDLYREIPSPPDCEDRQGWLSQMMKQSWQEQSEPIQAWRDALWDSLFELDSPTVIFTHFMVINAVVSRLSNVDVTVCCVPDNCSITRLNKEDMALNLVEVGRQHQTHVN
jgi:broad specificity phosphatase PhoE